MADHFYAFSDTAAHRAVTGGVVKATSTQSTKVELRVTDAQSISKARLLDEIEAIYNYVLTDSAPA